MKKCFPCHQALKDRDSSSTVMRLDTGHSRINETVTPQTDMRRELMSTPETSPTKPGNERDHISGSGLRSFAA